MKKSILILIFGLTANLSYSQEIPKFTFGPQVGWLSSKLSTNLNDNYNDFKSASKTGFMYGAFFRFGSRTYLQPEIYFSTKGGVMDYNINPSNVNEGIHITQDITFKTVDVPLLFGHNFVNKRAFNLRAFIGPVASMIIEKNIDLTKGSDNGQQLTKSDFKNAIWAGQVGAGFDILMLTFNVSYEFGLNDISNSPSLSNTKNNLFLISMGWKIF
jgi:hypothetical protein